MMSIVVTLLFWLVLPAGYKVNENSDNRDHYEPVARSILAGQGITMAGQPTARTPPGYSVLLAAQFGLADLLKLNEDTVLSAFTLLCVGLLTVLVFLMARSAWGLGPALVSAVAWMTYPFALWLTKQPNAELPFMVVLYGGFTLCWYAVLGKGRPWLLCFAGGLLIGVAMLIHPIAIGLGLVMGAIVGLARTDVTRRARLLCAGLVLLGNLVAVLPWEVWVYERMGKVVPLGGGGRGSMLDGLTFAVQLRGFRLLDRVPADVLALMRDVDARRAEAESLGGVMTVMKEESQKRPLAAAKLLGLKIVRSWYGTDSGRFEWQIMLLQIPYLTLMLWGTWQAWSAGGVARKLAVIVWIVGLYFWGMSILVVSMLRYMMPAMGVLFLILAAWFVSVTGRRRLPIRQEATIG